MKTLFVCHYPLRHRRSIIIKLKSETTRAVSFHLMSYADLSSKSTRIVLTVRMRKSSRRSPGNFHIFCCSLKPSCRRFSLLKVAFHGTSGFREESRDITAFTAFLRDE